MRVKTDGEYEYRLDLYDRAAELLGESTRSGGLDAASEFTRRILSNLDKAKDHPDMTPELAELLSTPRVRIRHETKTAIEVNE